MGIKGKDFVLVAGDTSATQQIITIKHDEDKLVPIDSHKLMCLSGAASGQPRLSRVLYCCSVQLFVLGIADDEHIST